VSVIIERIGTLTNPVREEQSEVAGVAGDRLHHGERVAQ